MTGHGGCQLVAVVSDYTCFVGPFYGDEKELQSATSARATGQTVPANAWTSKTMFEHQGFRALMRWILASEPHVEFKFRNDGLKLSADQLLARLNKY